MEPNSMEMEFNVKTEEMDYPANCNSSLTSTPQQSSQDASRNLQGSVPKQQEGQVKKEKLDGYTFNQATIMKRGSSGSQEEEMFVITSYRSLANDPAEMNKWNVQSLMLTESNVKTEVIDDPATCSSITINEKPFKCDGCDYSASQMCHLMEHKRIHSGEKPFKCNECEYSCYRNRQLKLHKLGKHTTVKPFNCDECDYSCSQKSDLTKHKIIHTGDKPFKCGECEYCSSRKDNLKSHKLNKHTTNKPIKSDNFDLYCSRKDHLKLHKLSKHTTNKPFKCEECGYSCSQKNDLTKHKRIHSAEKPFKCDECQYSCSQKGHLKLHKLRKHTAGCN